MLCLLNFQCLISHEWVYKVVCSGKFSVAVAVIAVARIAMSGAWFDDMWESGSAYSDVTEGESSSNTTLSCAARSIQGPVVLPYSIALTTTVRAVLATYYIITTLAGIILNTLVIVLVAKYKKLHTHSFVIALQVVGVDLVRSLMFLAGVVNIIANRWMFGEHMCALTGIFLGTITQVRTILMFVFVTGRYLSVFYPYWYPAHKVKITTCLSLASWLIIILSSIVFLPGILDCYAFGTFPSQWMCIRTIECSPECSLALRIHLGILVLPDTTVPIFMYGRLFYKARKIQRTQKAQVSESAAAKELRQRERKTTVTFFLLFIAVAALVLPNALLLLAISTVSSHSDGKLHPTLYLFGMLCFAVLSLLPIIDPIVIMRNRDVREILASLKGSSAQKWHAHRHKCQKKATNGREPNTISISPTVVIDSTSMET